MSKVLLFAVFCTISVQSTENLTPQCEEAIQKATKTHWNYVNGIVDLTTSYNATKEAEKICGFKLT